MITVMAILAGLLLPALHRSKVNPQGIACMHNHRELALAWHVYMEDNRETLLYARW